MKFDITATVEVGEDFSYFGVYEDNKTRVICDLLQDMLYDLDDLEVVDLEVEEKSRPY